MKLIVVAFALLAVIALTDKNQASALPAKGDKSKDPCPKVCTAIYAPICVHDPTDSSFKGRTFGSPCAFKAYNCENKSRTLVKKHDGECKNADGSKSSVRLQI